MKKCALQFLLICSLFSCYDSKTDTPKLELDGIFLNGGDENYSYNLEDVLPLHAGDYIDASFLLCGNEVDLVSFVVKNDNTNIDVVISSYPEDEVASGFLPTDEMLMLRYKDGVRNSSVKVRIRVKQPENDAEIRLAFVLNSKASDNGGVAYYLDLVTTATPREPAKE